MVENGEVDKKVLSKLVKEAYVREGLYAECEIQVTRREIFNSNASTYLSYVTYKELWDCHRNLSGRDDLHPYDKTHPFSLGKAFAAQLVWERFLIVYQMFETMVVGNIEYDEENKSNKAEAKYELHF
ncbi:MAG: hypothetical protein ACW98D_19395 [Promethearchaeota archaeon]